MGITDYIHLWCEWSMQMDKRFCLVENECTVIDPNASLNTWRVPCTSGFIAHNEKQPFAIGACVSGN